MLLLDIAMGFLAFLFILVAIGACIAAILGGLYAFKSYRVTWEKEFGTPFWKGFKKEDKNKNRKKNNDIRGIKC